MSGCGLPACSVNEVMRSGVGMTDSVSGVSVCLVPSSVRVSVRVSSSAQRGSVSPGMVSVMLVAVCS